MGMVFQSFGLMPHLNVIRKHCLSLKLQGIGERERYTQAERVIELVDLQGRESNFRTSCQEDSSSASASPGHWLLSQKCGCLTSRFQP